MEIRELIKSNIFLISLYVGVIILIALIIYLVRTISRKKELSNIDKEQDDMELDDSEGIVSIQKLKNITPQINQDNSSNFTESVKRKFEVINKIQFDKDPNNLTDEDDHKCKEVYESTASKLMFKFNPPMQGTVE